VGPGKGRNAQNSGRSRRRWWLINLLGRQTRLKSPPGEFHCTNLPPPAFPRLGWIIASIGLHAAAVERAKEALDVVAIRVNQSKALSERCPK
jgi:hypothetical protein